MYFAKPFNLLEELFCFFTFYYGQVSYYGQYLLDMRLKFEQQSVAYYLLFTIDEYRKFNSEQ